MLTDDELDALAGLAAHPPAIGYVAMNAKMLAVLVAEVRSLRERLDRFKAIGMIDVATGTFYPAIACPPLVDECPPGRIAYILNPVSGEEGDSHA